MIRRIVLAAAMAATASIVRAQEPPIRLELSPAKAPVPALKYYLFPQVRDLSPGNAVQVYYRAMNPEWYSRLQRDPKLYDRLVELGDKPLKDLSPAEVKELGVVRSWKMLQDVDRGARRSYCDWELIEPLRKEGIALPLPDIQSMRGLGVLLRARAKAELAAGDFDAAARTLQTGLAMARHIAMGPTLIQSLVGVAIGATMLGVVDDWVNLPDAPNLYWALTVLPHPLIDLRTGFEGERLWLDALFPGYRERIADPAIPPPPTAELHKYFAYLCNIEAGSSRALWGFGLALQDYPQAKQFLREHGRSAEQIEAMPVLDAVFLYEVYKYDVAYDNARKAFGLPFREAVELNRRVYRRFEEQRSTHLRDLPGELLPAVQRVLFAPARVERKIAALRCIEAIRLYASANGGRLPAKLSDVTEVPVPVDPITGKPFEYRLDGERAILTGPQVGALPNTSHYELTIRPAKGEK
jgi:hypothetical protein